MKTVTSLIAIALGIFGFIFILGSQGVVLRIILGIILWVAAGTMVYMTQMKPQVIQNQTTVVQKIDLSGDLNLEQMTCKSCGATLSKNSVAVRAGGVFINCEHCDATYQIEEEPKW